MFSLFSEPFLLAVTLTALCFFLALFSLFRPFSFRFSFTRFTPPFNHCNCASSDSQDSVPYLNGTVAEMMEISPSPAPVVLPDRRSGSSMMEELVPEITTHALSYLDYPSLCRLSMTNSLMRKAANDDNAWKALYHKDFTLEQSSVTPRNGWKAYYAATRAIVIVNTEFFNIVRDKSIPAMRRFWLNADYVKCIHASGELFSGYNGVMRGWQLVFNWEQGLNFQVRDVRARVLSDMAWVTMKTYVDMDTGPFNVTNVFEFHNGRWYMVHHHSSVMSRRKRRKTFSDAERVRIGNLEFRCCCSESVTPIRRTSGHEKIEERRFDPKKNPHVHRVRTRATPAAMPFASPPSILKQEKFSPRCTPRNSGPQSRDTPPKRDTGIANEKDWGISLLNENVKESGTNEDGSTWYRENGEELGENGYRCRWTRMGGQSHDSSSEWKETWWEKSDWTGYKELGVEKSGRNSEGDSWWETWQENLHQDEWSNIARIERSAQKQAKSGTENAGWYEKWWEKYDAKGWTEKGAHKYGRLNEQSWWEKWGEHYDGRGSVLKWTDKWAETELGTKWGDKWEERFFKGIGSRHGETWHVSPSSERWSRTWGEEHFGNGKVHKYGNSTTGESWDIVVDEETYYEAEPHYGWADVVGDSSQLLSIEPLDRPPGVFPNLDFGSPPLPQADDHDPPVDFPSSQ